MVCKDNPDMYANPEALHTHLEQAHDGVFPSNQLLAIARQSKVERQRPWNECLLCCFSIEEVEPPPKRRKERLTGENGNKRSKTNNGMKQSKVRNEIDHGSDTGDNSLDVSAGPTSISNGCETVARHVAAHLQALMLLTIRIASIHDDDDQVSQDDAGSASVYAGSSSVDSWDSDDTPFNKSAEEMIADAALTKNHEMADANQEAYKPTEHPVFEELPNNTGTSTQQRRAATIDNNMARRSLEPGPEGLRRAARLRIPDIATTGFTALAVVRFKSKILKRIVAGARSTKDDEMMDISQGVYGATAPELWGFAKTARIYLIVWKFKIKTQRRIANAITTLTKHDEMVDANQEVCQAATHKRWDFAKTAQVCLIIWRFKVKSQAGVKKPR